MRKVLAVVLFVVLTALLLPAAALGDDAPNGAYEGFPIVRLVVDGKVLTPPVPAVNLYGSTLVPIRAVFEALGETVEWDGEHGSAYVMSYAQNWYPLPPWGGDPATFRGFDVVHVWVNGHWLSPSVPAVNFHDRTLAPVRAVAEAIGLRVTWDAATWTAHIDRPAA